MICQLAPAKINLTLEVLGKRADGYHEIISVMQTIDICDVLTFWENEWIKIIPDYNNLPEKDSLFFYDDHNYLNNNLVYKAAILLKEISGYKGGAVIYLHKNIPSSAGLGGGSSDAAAALKGLNKLWKLNLTNDELAEIGSKIGSDIPFFIYGGTCIARGRGEILEKINSLPEKWLTVVLLPINIKQKTKVLYSMITPKNYTNGFHTTKILNAILNSSNSEIFEKDINFNNNGEDNDNFEGCNLNGIIDESNNSIDGTSFNFSKSKSNVLIESLKKINTTVLTKGNNFLKDYIFNVFEEVYAQKFSCYRKWLRVLEDLTGVKFHLAGSGPAVFCLADSENEAKKIICKIEKINKLKKFITKTVP